MEELQEVPEWHTSKEVECCWGHGQYGKPFWHKATKQVGVAWYCDECAVREDALRAMDLARLGASDAPPCLATINGRETVSKQSLRCLVGIHDMPTPWQAYVAGILTDDQDGTIITCARCGTERRYFKHWSQENSYHWRQYRAATRAVVEDWEKRGKP